MNLLYEINIPDIFLHDITYDSTNLDHHIVEVGHIGPILNK